MGTNFHREWLSLAEQNRAFREQCPQWRLTHFDEKYAVWNGTFKPNGWSAEYQVNIEYEMGSTPGIYVVKPNLQRYKDERIPHMYLDGSLCLFHGEWNPRIPIATSIVPWSALWFHFYECWLTTGHWHGGGTTHAKVPA